MLALKFVSVTALVGLAVVAAIYLPRRFARTIDGLSARQRNYLDTFSPRWIDGCIVLSAGLSLVLELAVIRWQGAIFELFAFYKNFTLLACFLGLGLGYALANRSHIPLLMSVPLLSWQIVLLTITRYGPPGWNTGLLRATPFAEQFHMGLGHVRSSQYASVMLLLVVVFVLTALAFVPIGQLCGCLMNRRPKLRAYGLNLLGSLGGVVLMHGLSAARTPPLIWLGLCFAAMLAFQAFHRRLLLFGGAGCLLGLLALAWPTTFLWEQVYSPYQLIERGPGERGLCTIRAAGHYYQRILDFDAALRDPALHASVAYYALPYQVHGHPGRVAVVGAGTGNDAAMALRMGASQVDAIEIDPAILDIGIAYHPHRPYQDPRVRAIVEDARSFLRRGRDSYDLIVYGLLDSHTLLGPGTNVRLDSFVYTVEAFREARRRLAPDGTLSLAFTVLAPEQGRKIYRMLQEAFDGQAPACVRGHYDGAVVFLQRQGGAVELPAGLLGGGELEDAAASFADPTLHADVSTDDWPFFYMPRRVYPTSYVLVLGILLVVSVVLVWPFFQGQTPWGRGDFFFLGAGFMLVETKGITELGLTFGNTWQVLSIVLASILVMAFLANALVGWMRWNSLVPTYLLLSASLLLGLFVTKAGFAPTPAGRLGAVAVLTCPLFFSGLVFSSLLQRSQDVSGAMAANLVGAICGGLLEYNSMYFGLSSLYWIALMLYAASFSISLLHTCGAKG